MRNLPTDAKILLVTEAAGGGSGRHFIDLAQELSRRGHTVHAVYSRDRAEERFEDELRSVGVPIGIVPMRRGIGPWDAVSAWRLRRYIVDHGPFAVVHGHSSKAGAIARMVAPRQSLRIYTPHAFRTMDPTLGAPGRLFYGTIEALLDRVWTDGVIAVSTEEHDHGLTIGIAPSRMFTVLNGIRPFDGGDRAALRQSIGLTPDAVAVGFVGRFTAQKNPVRFVEAIRAAADRDPRIRGVMIGTGELQAEVERASDERILFLGNRDAKGWFAAFDVLAMTSNYEGLPYVLIEALHAGLPIVSTDVGGTAATIRPGINGERLPVDVTATDFAASLLGVLEGDRMTRYAAASRAMASAFTVEHMVDQTLDVYRTCLARRSA
jgi:glycosyltransferase involved in cell wall biosynthesis